MADLIMRPNQRVDWWQIVQDLRRHGQTLANITTVTEIPRSTLIGYKNMYVEPKHADGVRLLTLWRQHMHPAVPVLDETVRRRKRHP